MSRRLSVVVFGNSLSILQVPSRTRHADGTYGEVLRDLLEASGVGVDLHLEGRWFDFVPRGLRRYEESLRAHAPDVVIVHYGINEAQPWLAPVWLIAHLMSNRRATTRSARWYRAHVTPPAWRALRRYRRWAAPRVGLRTWQTTPDRFAASMRSLIHGLRYELRPLVLVIDLAPPTAILERALPGMHARHAVIQRALAEVVSGFADPDVRLVRLSDLVGELGEHAALPDGIHLHPQAHRRLGEVLAREVDAWLVAQGGLATDRLRVDRVPPPALPPTGRDPTPTAPPAD